MNNEQPDNRILIFSNNGDEVKSLRKLIIDSATDYLFIIDHALTLSAALSHITKFSYNVVILDDTVDDKTVAEFVSIVRSADIVSSIIFICDKENRSIPPLLELIEADDYLYRQRLTPEIISVSLKYAARLHKKELERLEAIEALRKERNFISTVMDLAGALVVVLDARGRIVRYNSYCEQLTGYTYEEVVGKSLWDYFILPEEADKIKKVFQELNPDNLPVVNENFWQCKRGRRLISWSNTAIFDKQGFVEFIVAIGTDITEQRQAEIERERLIGDLKDALERVKTLQGLIPICAYCRKIRDDKGYWENVESFIKKHSMAEFSHGICPDCAKTVFADVYDEAMREKAEEEQAKLELEDVFDESDEDFVEI